MKRIQCLLAGLFFVGFSIQASAEEKVGSYAVSCNDRGCMIVNTVNGTKSFEEKASFQIACNDSVCVSINSVTGNTSVVWRK